MHPSSNRSLMTHVAYAVSLGLMVASPPLGLIATRQFHRPSSPRVATRAEDDRGSGRLSRVPAIPGPLSFRGSGRVTPLPPPPGSARPEAVVYRGSGRIQSLHTT
ncbi:hypothetical protein [Leptolyngbya sp. KIOST-1]|uniref:hypothetical protein n=1 Tax=Leptolyngbya sp. KIOST-1 TaxID=1229172 RepID=UPI000ACAD75D|nr:hypothetical protein [Leptolyngbya sp. KIOST-1]